jgi:pimeloyl-ACP methyl ester carboxylesterase
MPYLNLNGERIYYALHRNGSNGVPVLLIHGAGENHLVWPIGLRRLPESIVYAIDLPGHGKSEGRSYSSIDQYADWISSFMEAAQIDHAILIGHSMGGAIAQLCALSHPDRIDGLVLIATGAKLRVAPQLLQLVASDFGAAVHLVNHWIWGAETPAGIKQLGKQQLLQIEPKVLLDDYLACDAFDVRARLPEVHAPALIITGEADQMTPLKHAVFLEQQLPQARLVAVPQAGHMVMLEAAEVVTRAVDEFVSEVVTKAAQDSAKLRSSTSRIFCAACAR